MLALPVLWIEAFCTRTRDPAEAARPPLVTDPGYQRRESDSYLSFPEWHIVYAYEDLAGILWTGDESRFAYGGQITGFWRSLCELTRLVSARGGAGVDTKVMLYTIGWSFSAELALKGLYEQTSGRMFEWLRGPVKTDEDVFAARDMAAYAAFLRQTPWYEYPFASRLRAFWRDTPVRGGHWTRKLERRVVLSIDYGVKALYGAGLGYASGAALGHADLRIKSVVAGLDATDRARWPRLEVIRDLGAGRTLIVTPRYRAYTELVVDLARRGRDVVEIAGNHRILVTVLAGRGPLPTVRGARVLFEAPLQSRPDGRRFGLDVAVPQLAATIRALESAGATIEHVYDY